MIFDLKERMAKALRLTRAGQLAEATALLQAMAAERRNRRKFRKRVIVTQ